MRRNADKSDPFQMVETTPGRSEWSRAIALEPRKKRPPEGGLSAAGLSPVLPTPIRTEAFTSKPGIIMAHVDGSGPMHILYECVQESRQHYC